MIVRNAYELTGPNREVSAENWISRRMLLKEDGMGFSFHDTTIRAGTTTEMHYQNHLEAVYCVEGDGSLTDLTDGTTYEIKNGVMYALSGHEKHVLQANTDLRLICVFNPPLVGPETHDAEGVYPLLVD